MIHRTLLTVLLAVFGTSLIQAQPLPEIAYSGGARSHPFDVLHMSLDISFDFGREIVFGHVTHHIRSLNPKLSTVHFDADSAIVVSSLTVDGNATEYSHLGNDLFIVLPTDLSYNDTFSIAIVYTVTPKKGLYFVKKEPAEQDGRDQIWTQGEGEDHHFWIPMYDSPNDLVTSEIRGTVRSDWNVLSNGELVSRQEITPGQTTWHYRMDKPHAPYLMMFAAGDYLITHDTVQGMAGNIPLEYWSYPDLPERVQPTFQNTPDMFLYLENLLGVPYPWNKYSQIVIDEFMYGGMENTTATTLNDYALVSDTMRLDYNPDGLIAHELAHQWFGDLVTNRSWDHLWIHESFATYLAARYLGYKYGQDAYDQLMDRYARGAVDTDKEHGRSPIAGGGGYTSNIYGRGAFVLHMLNEMLGEELFLRSVRYFLTKHAHSVVETNDLKLAFEDVTGYNLDWFFKQWVYGTGVPELLVTQEYWGDSLRLIVEQRHKRDSLTGTFRLPLTVEAHYPNNLISSPGNSSSSIVRSYHWLSDSVDTLVVAVPKEPAAVIFDAGNVAMKQLEFNRPPSVLLQEFTLAQNSVDRVQALRQLALKDDDDFEDDPTPIRDPYRTLGEQFLYGIQRDSSSWVRETIISTAVELRVASVRDIIAVGLKDSEKDVREIAVDEAWAVENKADRAALLRPMLKDKSLSIGASALELLAATDTAGLLVPLEQMQYVVGQREHTARAWLGAVAIGKFNQFADRVAWYALNGVRHRTRRKAFESIAELTVTTPAIRDAIIHGLQAESDDLFNAALLAAKAHKDNTMENMIQEILHSFSEDRSEKIEDVM